MRKTINLLNTSREDVLDAVDWLRERQCWTVIVEIAERFSDTFQRDPMLQYRLAETYIKLGNAEKANAAAHQALEAVPGEIDRHLEIAANLQTDGLFEWAELEYRHVAKQVDDEPTEAIRAQIFLSELLHETGKEKEAGDVLTELVELVSSKDDIRKMMEMDLGRDMGGLKSRLHFFRAQQYGKNKQFQQQREELLKGLESDPFDADVLIAMYRVPDADDAWKKKTRQHIQEAVEHFREEIRGLAEQISGLRPVEDRAFAQFQLALSNNQLAWLIANTEGDYEEALRCSLRSLELQRDRSGFLDTLGRCFYAKGDYENAVKYQSLALAKEPHSPPMQAQLKLFQEALEKQQAEQGKPATKPTEQQPARDKNP